MGYTPAEVVPAVLLSECITGTLAGVLHHEFGNVELRPGARDFKVALVLTGFSLLGVGVAVNISAWAVKVYVGLLVLGIGLFILRNHRREIPFSWRRIGGLGLLAAFNKGISGGGYGPVVTGGQVLSGVRGRSAIGIASLAEGIIILDPQDRITFFSHGAERITGWKKEQVLNRLCDDVFWTVERDEPFS
jgi:hypothetical protein